MPSGPAMLLGSFLLMVATTTVAQPRGQKVSRSRWIHRIQQGQCSYTFVLPEPCLPEPEPFGSSNSLPGDSPADPPPLGDWRSQRVRQLEKVLENNTLWLQKLERYIQMNLKPELTQAQQHMVQNQTATVLELGSNLLNQTTTQAHKLTNVEAQVLNQTSRMKAQLLEASLSTNKLEKQLLLQGIELHQLQTRNSALETRVLTLETQQQAELDDIRDEKERLQHLLGRQSGALAGLERSLRAASSNSSLLQRQQRQLLESVQRLVQVVAQGPASAIKAAEQMFQDCAEIQRSGANASGTYTIHVANVTKPRKVFCDLETSGGGWTLIQRRENGSVNFQRNWKDYKQGFGDPAGEYWLGNELVHQLTSRATYSLRVELRDWEGNEVYAQYEHFQLGSEGQLYRLSLSGYSGSAGRQSSLVLQGTNFSTADADNDNCHCKCAQMLSGGWWFDACGLSNLNGNYYSLHQHMRKLNGIRWHYFKGPSYSLRATRMMIRPVDL
ncbi:PREDICTED: angiopoietin-4 [Chrysochloris asiatica]|uniref:Angiopoietin-4 n=1 Tax=Chrysochloris asiatica TaxID=185453 RepID=A0A9B0WMY9_CHRAS|nr:PREDICTED: angiopoietin-4 [Chrysochloris asiatica]